MSKRVLELRYHFFFSGARGALLWLVNGKRQKNDVNRFMSHRKLLVLLAYLFTFLVQYNMRTSFSSSFNCNKNNLPDTNVRCNTYTRTYVDKYEINNVYVYADAFILHALPLLLFFSSSCSYWMIITHKYRYIILIILNKRTN